MDLLISSLVADCSSLAVAMAYLISRGKGIVDDFAQGLARFVGEFGA